MSTTILVVDDEQPTLDMLEMLLEAYGYQVLLAHDGKEALDLFKEKNPPLVLTDIKMPIMDGMEVLNHIKDINPLTEVIVITGHGDMDLAINALNLDATDFINKPVQRKALEQALKRAENRVKMSRSKEEEIFMESEGDVCVITVRGSLTSASEPFLVQLFTDCFASGCRRILLRFAENASINGAGVALLTEELKKCREADVRLDFVGAHESFMKVFEIVGITRQVAIFPDVESALAQDGAQNRPEENGPDGNSPDDVAPIEGRSD